MCARRWGGTSQCSVAHLGEGEGVRGWKGGTWEGASCPDFLYAGRAMFSGGRCRGRSRQSRPVPGRATREGLGGSRRLASAAPLYTDTQGGLSRPRRPGSRLGRGWGTRRAGSRAGGLGCCRPRQGRCPCRIRGSWRRDSRWCW